MCAVPGMWVNKTNVKSWMVSKELKNGLQLWLKPWRLWEDLHILGDPNPVWVGAEKAPSSYCTTQLNSCLYPVVRFGIYDQPVYHKWEISVYHPSPILTRLFLSYYELMFLTLQRLVSFAHENSCSTGGHQYICPPFLNQILQNIHVKPCAPVSYEKVCSQIWAQTNVLWVWDSPVCQVQQ